MKKNSIISIRNNQIIDSETDTIQLTTVGSYIKKNGKCYIVYKDYKSSPQENKPLLSIVKVQSPDLIIISNTGPFRSQLTLERSKRHYCRYETEFGPITMGIYTKFITCDLKESSAEINILYYMDINADVTSINEISISVKEKIKNVKCIDNVD